MNRFKSLHPEKHGGSPRAYANVGVSLGLAAITVRAIFVIGFLPVFAKARENARQTQGLSDLRQLGAALRIYADEYDGERLRHASSATGRGRPGSDQWQHDLRPYFKNRRILVCPNTPHLDGRARHSGFDWDMNQNDPALRRDGKHLGRHAALLQEFCVGMGPFFASLPLFKS